MSADGKHADLTGAVIGAFFKVYNILGYGFSEKVYERALTIELKKAGLHVETQKNITVYYETDIVGEYVADVLINQAVIIELKAVRQLTEEHEAQLLNYLKATTIEVGLLLNFGIKAEHKRKVYDNDRKGSMTWLKPGSVAGQNL